MSTDSRSHLKCVCLECQLAEAVVKSLQNFGTPEVVYCGVCGRKFTYQESIEHFRVTPNGECFPDVNS